MAPFLPPQGNPCGNKNCSVCSICTQGFVVEGNAGRTAQATNISLRYGEGIYFSSVSGKANDYAGLSEKVCIVVSWDRTYGDFPDDPIMICPLPFGRLAEIERRGPIVHWHSLVCPILVGGPPWPKKWRLKPVCIAILECLLRAPCVRPLFVSFHF